MHGRPENLKLVKELFRKRHGLCKQITEWICTAPCRNCSITASSLQKSDPSGSTVTMTLSFDLLPPFPLLLAVFRLPPLALVTTSARLSQIQGTLADLSEHADCTNSMRQLWADETHC